jgi:hypothetical protein
MSRAVTADGPTMLVGHSFSGMIVTEASMYAVTSPDLMRFELSAPRGALV